jgi:hypothetical protein
MDGRAKKGLTRNDDGDESKLLAEISEALGVLEVHCHFGHDAGTAMKTEATAASECCGQANTRSGHAGIHFEILGFIALEEMRQKFLSIQASESIRNRKGRIVFIQTDLQLDASGAIQLNGHRACRSFQFLVTRLVGRRIIDGVHQELVHRRYDD